MSEDKKTKKEQDLEVIEAGIQDLLNDPKNIDFRKNLSKAILFLKTLEPFLDYGEIKKEISKIEFNTRNMSTYDDDLHEYADILGILQGYRDRISSIFSRAENEYTILEEYYNSLKIQWTGKFSRLSSDKRREGEAEFILSFFIQKRLKSKILFNYVKNSYKNISNKIEVISRKYTVISESNKITGVIKEGEEKPLPNKDKKTKDKLNKFYQDLDREATGWDLVPSQKNLDK